MRLWAGALLFVACASSADHARQAVATGEQFISAAVASFERYDHDHQVDLARKAAASHNFDAGAKELAEWRAKRAPVRQALFDAQAVLAAAPSVITLCEAGARSKGALVPLLAQVAASIDQVRQALKALGVDIP